MPPLPDGGGGLNFEEETVMNPIKYKAEIEVSVIGLGKMIDTFDLFHLNTGDMMLTSIEPVGIAEEDMNENQWKMLAVLREVIRRGKLEEL